MWLITTIFAYFFLAAGSLFDRLLLTKKRLSPYSYAFTVGALGGFAVLLVPFGLSRLSLPGLLLSLSAGAVWIAALFALYSAISKSEVTRVVPAIGAFLPFFTFLLSFLVFPEKMEFQLYYIFVLALLSAGGFLISWKKEGGVDVGRAVFAAFLFGLGFLLMKGAYQKQTFLSAFIWMRIGGFIAALLLLLFRKTRDDVFRKHNIVKQKTPLFLIIGQLVSGAGFLLQNYAVSEASIAQLPLINALEGTRYVFLIIFVFLLEKARPGILIETMSGRGLLQKITAILLICAGLILLSFQ